MERIYNPHSFRSSEHIPVQEYFEEYSKVCQFNFPDIKLQGKIRNLDIREEMGLDLSNDEFDELGQSCSLDKLTIADEPPNVPAEVPEKLQTKTRLTAMYPIKSNSKHLNVLMCREVLDKKHNITEDFKFGSKRFLKTMTVTSNKSRLCDIVPGSNFIYSVIVYRPYSINYGQRNSAEKLRFAYEIEALGTNTLAEVADTIVCISNIALYKEVENTAVDLSPFMNAKEHYPSQSIFIDGVFYNDTRNPKAVDYSAQIIEWAKDKQIGEFKSEIMQETKLLSLKPRLGYPYVYIHQGNCEHIFTFSDARLIQPSDCLLSKKYPRIVSISRPSNIICFICGAVHSQWIVINCCKFPQEKVFLCTACCNSYLFVDGKKVVDFQLYPFYDQELMARHLNIITVD